MSDGPDLGPCCGCGAHDDVTNILMLEWQSPTPGRGWGCLQCSLPSNGAIAVMCGRCMTACQSSDQVLRYVCTGWPRDGGRTPIAQVDRTPHVHNPARHPEVTVH